MLTHVAYLLAELVQTTALGGTAFLASCWKAAAAAGQSHTFLHIPRPSEVPGGAVERQHCSETPLAPWGMKDVRADTSLLRLVGWKVCVMSSLEADSTAFKGATFASPLTFP